LNEFETIFPSPFRNKESDNIGNPLLSGSRLVRSEKMLSRERDQTVSRHLDRKAHLKELRPVSYLKQTFVRNSFGDCEAFVSSNGWYNGQPLAQ
jgi:hypothetical protein